MRNVGACLNRAAQPSGNLAGRQDLSRRPSCVSTAAVLLDYHMHTRLTDGTGMPADYASIALERGLDEIGCSDHAPLGNRDTDWTMKLADLETYVGWVREAQKKFPQLPIKLGLEVDFIPGREDWIRELAAMYPWDFFLGSEIGRASCRERVWG